MNSTLLTALIALVPTCVLLSVCAVLSLIRGKTLSSLLQLFGAGCLMVVVLTSVKRFSCFRGCTGAYEHSVGHYLDLSSAVLGVTLFPLGYLFHRRERQSLASPKR